MSDFADWKRALIYCNEDPKALQDMLRIEDKHGLMGYSPELVTIGLQAAERGLNAVEAVADYIREQS